MATKLASSRPAALAAGTCLMVFLYILLSFPVWAGESSVFSIPASGFTRNGDGYYSTLITVPAFDRVSVYWNRGESPILSLRILDEADGVWGEWQDIQENGQTYIHRMNGIFNFDLSGSQSQELKLEIRIKAAHTAQLKDIRLEFINEPRDTAASIVMIAVMLAAGGVYYLKRRAVAT